MARPSVPKWNDISAAIQDQIFPAYNGEKDPASAAKEQHLAEREDLTLPTEMPHSTHAALPIYAANVALCS